jgi:hypothetical protein
MMETLMVDVRVVMKVLKVAAMKGDEKVAQLVA